MNQTAGKRGLRIKIILISILSISLPITLSIFATNNPIILGLAALGVITFATFAILLLLKPLDILLKGAEILSGGGMNHRIDIRSGDEFEEVGKSFNLTAEKLMQAFQNLEKDKDAVSVERNNLSTILSSIFDGIIAVDLSRNVSLVNRAGEYLIGYPQTELIGKPIEQFIRLYSDNEEVLPKTYCQPNFSRALRLLGKGGKQTKVNITTTPISEEVTTNLGSILLIHDLSKEAELEQMKLDFVSMASHELKTPLTSIIGYLSVFVDENKDKISKEELDLLQRSLVTSKQLLALVGNLLSVNKIEKEQLAVTIESIDYSNIIGKAVEDLQNQAKLKDITLTLNLPPTPLPKILADSVRVAEVITNLVSNAINYTNSGGAVSILVQDAPTEVTTTIQDTGVGIPKEAIPHLFNKFFRVSNKLQQANKGTGLGLYIAKSIIQKLNGKIWVESEEGKGSKFSFTLPVASQSSINLDTSKFTQEAIKMGALNY